MLPSSFALPPSLVETSPSKPESDNEDFDMCDVPPNKESDGVVVSSRVSPCPTGAEEISPPPATEDPPEIPCGINPRIMLNKAGPFDGGAKFASVEIAVKAKLPNDGKVDIYVCCCADTSASMSRNGGHDGLLETVKGMMGDFYTKSRLCASQVFVHVTFITFDETANMVPELEFSKLSEFGKVGGKVLDAIHCNGASTDLEAAVSMAYEITAKKLRSLQDTTDPDLLSSVGMVLLCTDGRPMKGIRDGHKIREMIADKYKNQSSLPITVHSIALGSDCTASFLNALCKPKGLIGYASNPTDAIEAFLSIFNKISEVKATLRVRATIMKDGHECYSSTFDFGLLTAANRTATFNLEYKFRGGETVHLAGAINDSFSVSVPNDTTPVSPAGEAIFHEHNALVELAAEQSEIISNTSLTEVEIVEKTNAMFLRSITRQHTSKAVVDRARSTSENAYRSLTGSQSVSPPIVLRQVKRVAPLTTRSGSYRSLGSFEGSYEPKEQPPPTCMRSATHSAAEAFSQSMF